PPTSLPTTHSEEPMDRLPDTPAPPITPTTITPAPLPTPAAGEREAMVWIPGPGNDFVAVPRSLLPADYLTPHPTASPALDPEPRRRTGIDPRAQILTAAGIATAGAGWGVAQVVSALAGFGAAGIAALALLLLATRIPRPTTDPHPNAGTEIHLHRGARVRARHLTIR
ncbi:hypothetical protein, partial [Streptomyces sp. ST2-7A]|uniref:hypothetical protein n=1 Tax=Streptomyces sp. ST2-7A TaxID=2907214 RepID=UPI002277B1AF